MSIKFTLTSALLLVTALPLTACTSPGRLEEEHIATTEQKLKGHNGLSSNGLSSNGLSSNGLSATGIAAASLTSGDLSNNSVVMGYLNASNDSVELLQYLTTCALQGDDSLFTLTINGNSVPFYGGLSLANQWAGGACVSSPPSSCPAWVSSCILSRVNYYGLHVPISVRGPDVPTSDDERNYYEAAEAVYFGDLFSVPPGGTQRKLYACRIGNSTLIERVCGPADQNGAWPSCIATVLGDCSNFCSGPDETDGHFWHCHDDASPANYYDYPITIYRDIASPFDPANITDAGPG